MVDMLASSFHEVPARQDGDLVSPGNEHDGGAESAQGDPNNHPAGRPSVADELKH
jgi:hypothetical protein